MLHSIRFWSPLTGRLQRAIFAETLTVIRVETVNPVLYGILESAAENIVPLGESDIIFTDDRAPVESLVDSIVLRFLLAGRAEEFRLDNE